MLAWSFVYFSACMVIFDSLKARTEGRLTIILLTAFYDENLITLQMATVD